MTPSGSEMSIQESLFPDLTCYGCGHANPDGVHLRSYLDGDRTVATFTPRPEHDNGFGSWALRRYPLRGVIGYAICPGSAGRRGNPAELGCNPDADISIA